MPYIYSIRMHIFLGPSPKPGCLGQIDPGFLHTSQQNTVSCMVTPCWGTIRSEHCVAPPENNIPLNWMPSSSSCSAISNQEFPPCTQVAPKLHCDLPKLGLSLLLSFGVHLPPDVPVAHEVTCIHIGLSYHWGLLTSIGIPALLPISHSVHGMQARCKPAQSCSYPVLGPFFPQHVHLHIEQCTSSHHYSQDLLNILSLTSFRRTYRETCY